MIVLAIDTSTQTGGVAVLKGDTLLAQVQATSTTTHTRRLMSAVDSALRMAGMGVDECDGLAVTTGPGSFTGLRIGISAVKGIGFANNAKIVPVDTLDVIAANITTENTLPTSSHEPPKSSIETIAAILDAKRSQFFIALYQRNTSNKRPVPQVRATSDGIWK
ncbi:MAG: tRNA (adenosine(37)-N6)-threonylcarbamoyltransferase complex dimerization subunit type 1 TsaB, partial [Desulfobacteraceae bacterium]|nr:tRNA (adenosine(37)-N6)-threonylcarbamoyltransferase complex dimerization subunit type 1 TsaB [Desulfobacteraceae bacterium]